MSPELLDPDQFGLKDSKPTKESDCYALGMVIYEVLSGQSPFTPHKDFIVMRKVIDGERPDIPEGAEKTWFTGNLRRTVELCWETQPGDRPSIPDVKGCLERVSRTWNPPVQPADEDVEMGEGEWDLTTVSDSSGMLTCFNLFYFVILRGDSVLTTPPTPIRNRPVGPPTASDRSAGRRATERSYRDESLADKTPILLSRTVGRSYCGRRERAVYYHTADTENAR